LLFPFAGAVSSNRTWDSSRDRACSDPPAFCRASKWPPKGIWKRQLSESSRRSNSFGVGTYVRAESFLGPWQVYCKQRPCGLYVSPVFSFWPPISQSAEGEESTMIRIWSWSWRSRWPIYRRKRRASGRQELSSRVRT